MPDFFRRNPLEFGLIPADTDEKKTKLETWLATTATKEILINDIKNYVLTLDFVKDNPIAILGFCFGGKYGLLFGDLQLFGNQLKCVAVLHPWQINDDILVNVKIPIYYGPAIGDYPASKAENAVKNGQNKQIYKDCIFHQFETMKHGFCAGRGDWSDDKVVKQVEVAIQETSQFFKKYL